LREVLQENDENRHVESIDVLAALVVNRYPRSTSFGAESRA
jgi:hypothetical protein